MTGDFDLELDACRRHTAFYYHSLGEYLGHFRGRDATYISVDAPAASADGGFALVRAALAIPDDADVGDEVTLTPAGLEPIEAVVDYATPVFLGVRSADALYRFYGRDAWGWPVGAAHHLFGARVDKDAAQRAWDRWLQSLFTTAEVA
jgi:hypothetical protein